MTEKAYIINVDSNSECERKREKGRQMNERGMEKENLKSNDAFLFRGFNLSNDVIVQGKNGDGNTSTPFVPEGSHSALEGNGACASGVRSHEPRLCFNDGQ